MLLAPALAALSLGFVSPLRCQQQHSRWRCASPKASFSSWLDSGEAELDLLPVAAAAAMLPGESQLLRVGATNTAQRATLMRAVLLRNPHGCVGQVIQASDGVSKVCGVIDVTRLGSVAGRTGEFVQLTCIGRAELTSPLREGLLKMSVSASVHIIKDAPLDPAGQQAAANVLDAQASCRTLHLKLARTRSNRFLSGHTSASRLFPPAGLETQLGSTLITRRSHLLQVLSKEGRPARPSAECSSLRWPVSRRGRVAAAQLDAPCSPSVEALPAARRGLRALWTQSEDEAALEAQLLSYAAWEPSLFDGAPDGRGVLIEEAMAERETGRRLQRAEAAFKQLEMRLAAQLALCEALPDFPESGVENELF